MPHMEALSCVDRADALLKRGDPDSLRYATLQLRLGLEYLVYELVKLYREELPDDVLKRWKPQQMLKALLDCNPDADKDGRIAFGPSGALDERWGEMVMEVKVPNLKLLDDHWHRLSHRLHAPVDMVEPNVDKWKRDLEKALACLREFEKGQALENIRAYREFDCALCGKRIVRNERAIEKTGVARCLNSECKAIYDLTILDDGFNYSLRQVPYCCPYCNEQNYVSVGGVQDGTPITCDVCEKRVVARSTFVLEPIDGEPTSPTTNFTEPPT